MTYEQQLDLCIKALNEPFNETLVWKLWAVAFECQNDLGGGVETPFPKRTPT